ncbi:MAG: hypothetical protein GY830_01610 [Bacteroidetes bacterium]|nr:hypothetical protein [Bacteroidota bacterium]
MKRNLLNISTFVILLTNCISPKEKNLKIKIKQGLEQLRKTFEIPSRIENYILNIKLCQYKEKKYIQKWLKDEFNIEYKILKLNEIKSETESLKIKSSTLNEIEDMCYKNLFKLCEEKFIFQINKK